LVVWLLTRGRLDIPPVRFPPAAYASLFTLNAVSAGALMAFFGWLLAGINRGVEDIISTNAKGASPVMQPMRPADAPRE
ncbi:MAG: hypothetical protein ABSC06_17960, partial [Rhodopila sp.]